MRLTADAGTEFTGAVTMSSSSASEPILHITNTHAGATAGEIRFNKASASGDDNDVMGTISWYGTDAAENTHERLAYIDAMVHDTAHGSEAAAMRFFVAENDATLTSGLDITGMPDNDGEVDVTIGAGAGSTCTVAGGLNVAGDLDMQDDKGIIFGSGDDWWFGAEAGEAKLALYKGNTQGAGTEEGVIEMIVGDSAYSAVIIKAGEGTTARLLLEGDQGEQASDQWGIEANDGSELYINNGGNTAYQTFQFSSAGNADADGTWNDNTWDYAELFEWKTHLDSDDAVKSLYGMSVVLDGDKVRVAESGEEDKILGVVRPKGSTASHGDGLRWQKKYIRNVWGEYEEEEYTMATWQEFLPNGNVEYRHAYPKDEIPEYRLEEGIGRNKDHHTKEENFKLDKDGEKIPVVVPSTEEEKTAANYVERTTDKTTGKTLSRRKYADDYDPSIPYVQRKDRPKEWVLIGLLGQVPVRTSAVIPDHWVKQKNLESGIDFYYIFNK